MRQWVSCGGAGTARRDPAAVPSPPSAPFFFPQAPSHTVTGSRYAGPPRGRVGPGRCCVQRDAVARRGTPAHPRFSSGQRGGGGVIRRESTFSPRTGRRATATGGRRSPSRETGNATRWPNAVPSLGVGGRPHGRCSQPPIPRVTTIGGRGAPSHTTSPPSSARLAAPKKVGRPRVQEISPTPPWPLRSRLVMMAGRLRETACQLPPFPLPPGATAIRAHGAPLLWMAGHLSAYQPAPPRLERVASRRLGRTCLARPPPPRAQVGRGVTVGVGPPRPAPPPRAQAGREADTTEDSTPAPPAPM